MQKIELQAISKHIMLIKLTLTFSSSIGFISGRKENFTRIVGGRYLM